MMPYTTTLTRADFLQAVRSYLGVPFRHQGRDRRGLDCAGLPTVAAQDCGAMIADELHYATNPDPTVMRVGIDQHFGYVPKTAVIPGDLLWLRWHPRAEPTHLLVVAGEGRVIHADGRRAMAVVEVHLPVTWFRLCAVGLRWRQWLT